MKKRSMERKEKKCQWTAQFQMHWRMNKALNHLNQVRFNRSTKPQSKLAQRKEGCCQVKSLVLVKILSSPSSSKKQKEIIPFWVQLKKQTKKPPDNIRSSVWYSYPILVRSYQTRLQAWLAILSLCARLHSDAASRSVHVQILDQEKNLTCT